MSDRIERLAGCLLLGVALLFHSLPGVAAGQRLPLWEASGEGRTVYLFGSIHVCTAACFPLGRSVLERFERSDALLVELDPARSDGSQALLAEGMLPAAEPLDAKLGQARSVRLQRAAAILGLDPSVLMRFRPWLLSATLSLQAAKNAGFDAAYGIDMWFLTNARASGKPLIELETMARQIQALAAGSEAEQLDALDRVVGQILDGQVGPSLSALIGAWQAGDAEALRRLVAEEMPEDAELTRELLDRRNREMAARILQLAKPGKRLFVTVGAAHLLGGQGLPDILRRAGLNVRQVSAGE